MMLTEMNRKEMKRKKKHRNKKKPVERYENRQKIIHVDDKKKEEVKNKILHEMGPMLVLASFFICWQIYIFVTILQFHQFNHVRMNSYHQLPIKHI